MKFKKSEGGKRITIREPIRVGDGDIGDVGNRGISKGYSGEILLVPMPEYHMFKNIDSYKMSDEIYSAMFEKHGTRMVSYKELCNTVKPTSMAKPNFSNILSWLWIHGRLEKYARGYYIGGLQKRYGVGRYHGVHYKILEPHENEANA